MKLNFIYRLQSRKFAIITIHLRLHKIQQFKATDWICHKAFGVTTFQRGLRLVEWSGREKKQLIFTNNLSWQRHSNGLCFRGSNLIKAKKSFLICKRICEWNSTAFIAWEKNFQHMQTFYFLSFELHLIAHLYSYFGHDNIFRENWRDNTFKDNPNVCFYLHSVV